MGHLLGRGQMSGELPLGLSFCHQCLLELVWRDRQGLSIGSSRGAGPLLLERGMSELLVWDLPHPRSFRERWLLVPLVLHPD